MSMRKFYSLVAMVQQDDIREQLFAWAAAAADTDSSQTDIQLQIMKKWAMDGGE